jgi:hypothetical protein
LRIDPNHEGAQKQFAKKDALGTVLKKLFR